jgi:hypothetical protein
MNQLNSFLALVTDSRFLILILVWSLFWKGCALWIAGKNNQKIWFWVILILNTVGILEIIYIFCIAKKKWSDIQEILSK